MLKNYYMEEHVGPNIVLFPKICFWLINVMIGPLTAFTVFVFGSLSCHVVFNAQYFDQTGQKLDWMAAQKAAKQL